jgi:RND family efflux transporter MFP subunit
MKDAEVSPGRGVSGRERRRVGRTLLVLSGLAVVVAVVLILAARREMPPRAEARLPGSAVSAGTVDAGDVPSVIRGQGVVAPKVMVDITAEVAGRATFLHSGLRAGGVIRAGEKVVQIDPSDYELAVRLARADVAEAQARLETETAAADIARRDWRRENPETQASSPLVLREPQVRQARAALEAAQARLATAELQGQRTVLSLPFDVLIVEKKVDLGQYVVAGQPLARVYGLEAFEVEVPLRDEDLARLDHPERLLPARSDARERPRVPAEVKARFAGREYSWQGYVVGARGQRTGPTSTLPVVVEIPRPLEASGERPALLPGTFVEVLITGRMPESADLPAGPLQDSEKP